MGKRKGESGEEDESDEDDASITRKGKELLTQLRKICLKSESSLKKVMRQSGINNKENFDSNDLMKILKRLDPDVTKKDIAGIWTIMDVEN